MIDLLNYIEELEKIKKMVDDQKPRYLISDTLTFAPALQAEIICKPSLSLAII